MNNRLLYVGVSYFNNTIATPTLTSGRTTQHSVESGLSTTATAQPSSPVEQSLTLMGINEIIGHVVGHLIGVFRRI